MSTHPPRFAMPRARRSIRALGLALMAFALLLPAAPIVAAATGCQSVYTGNHKGGVDVTSSLNRWLDNHRGRQLCLKTDGLYRIDGTVRISNENGLKLDGRGATIRHIKFRTYTAKRRVMSIESSRNVTIKNLVVRGYNKDYKDYNVVRQHEHGIGITGGYNIKLYRVTTRDTYGDGVYIGWIPGSVSPAHDITLQRVNLGRAGRSGVGIVGGHNILITDSTINATGIHGVNLENDLAAGNIHDVRVVRTRLDGFGRSPEWLGYGFIAYGWEGDMYDISVIDSRSTRWRTLVGNEVGSTYRNVTFRGNRSTYTGRAIFEHVDNLTWSGNSGIRITKVDVD